MTSGTGSAANGRDIEGSRQSELARVLDAYLEAVEAGEAVDPEALASAHPEIADRLRACLSVLRVASRVEVAADADAVEPGVDTRLGDFRLIRLIGRGGMGVVFEAEQVSLRRRVALKVLPFAAALDPHQLRRFQIEAQAAAQLHHTNIVPIFSVGCERGVHFYAMQYIEGQTLSALVNDLRRLSGREEPSTIELRIAGASLAEEIASGRLDPAPASDVATPEVPPVDNLPPRPDGERVPEGRVRGRSSGSTNTRTPAYFRTVAHLGLQAAEALDHAHRLGIIHRDIKPANLLLDIRGNLWVTDFGLARMQADSGLTMTGDVIGTLRYMSPEQSSARRAIVDHRADVYSLGATLYELLTLAPAHDGRDRTELLRQLAVEPRRPRHYDRTIPRDLETIVLKAMARDVGRRYATASALADDLRRFLDHRPIQARRPAPWTRCVRWARRHKALVATGLLLFLMLGVSATLAAMILTNQWRLDREAHHARYVEDLREAFRLRDENKLGEALRLLERHRPAPGETDERSFPWYYLRDACRPRLRSLSGFEGSVYNVEFAPDGRTIAAAGEDGTIRLWDAATDQPLRVLRGHDGEVNYVTFAPDGRTLASGGDDGNVRLWDVATGESRPTRGKHDDWVTCVLFTPDGKQVISGARDGRMHIWDVATGRKVKTLASDRPIEGLAISPDGRSILTVEHDGPARIWDLASGAVKASVTHPFGALPQCAAYSHDGRRFATSALDRSVRIWDAESGRLEASLSGQTHKPARLAFSPDNGTLATVDDGGSVRIWDLVGGRPLRTYRGQECRLWGLAFSPDGRLLATCGADGRIILWDTPADQGCSRFPIPEAKLESFIFSPDGRRATVFAARSREGHLYDLDLQSGERRTGIRFNARATFLEAAISPDGRTLATMLEGDDVVLWDATTGTVVERTRVPGMVSYGGFAFSPDSRWLALLGGPKEPLIIVEVGTGRHREIRHAGRAGGAVLFSPDGTRLLTGGSSLMLGDSSQGRFGPSIPIGYRSLAFSPDGRRVAIGGLDHVIRIREISSLNVGASLLGHEDAVEGLAWSPDGKVLASSGADRTIRLWDVASHQEIGTIGEMSSANVRLTFSPDGTRLAASVVDRPEVIIWSAPRDDRPRP